MLLDDAVRMQADDYEEFVQLVRRIDFLKMKSSPAWKYRKAEVCACYADVCDARFTQQLDANAEL